MLEILDQLEAETPEDTSLAPKVNARMNVLQDVQCIHCSNYTKMGCNFTEVLEQ